jgi:hypothetical protein
LINSLQENNDRKEGEVGGANVIIFTLYKSPNQEFLT